VEFDKRAKTSQELLAQLIDRGMVIDDQPQALQWLEHVNYYRLTPYWLPYRTTDKGGEHKFREHTTFSEVIQHYEFDRRLRALVFNSIERVEISLRRTLSSTLTLKYGAFAHLDKELISDPKKWRYTLKALGDAYVNSNEVFAVHHREKYPHLKLPPLWVAVELTTFGMLRNMYQNLRSRADRQAVALHYEIDESIFISLLKHLESVRNTCAHHARVWNRKFVIKTKLPTQANFKSSKNLNRGSDASGHIYNTIILLDYLESIILGIGELSHLVSELLEEYPSVNQTNMGYPI
jgi:abortive infection bacteriophage resistance protein